MNESITCTIGVTVQSSASLGSVAENPNPNILWEITVTIANQEVLKIFFETRRVLVTKKRGIGSQQKFWSVLRQLIIHLA